MKWENCKVSMRYNTSKLVVVFLMATVINETVVMHLGGLDGD